MVIAKLLRPLTHFWQLFTFLNDPKTTKNRVNFLIKYSLHICIDEQTTEKLIKDFAAYILVHVREISIAVNFSCEHRKRALKMLPIERFRQLLKVIGFACDFVGCNIMDPNYKPNFATLITLLIVVVSQSVTFYTLYNSFPDYTFMLKTLCAYGLFVQVEIMWKFKNQRLVIFVL